MHLDDRQLIILRNRLGENLPVPPKRKKRDNEESRIQQNVIRWWSLACAGFKVSEVLLFAIPNAGKRGAILGKIMKREGLRAGVSDLFLACPSGRFHGLFIEMKKPDGVLADSQYDFSNKASSKGYCCQTCYSYQRAIDVITAYLNGKEIQPI